MRWPSSIVLLTAVGVGGCAQMFGGPKRPAAASDALGRAEMAAVTVWVDTHVAASGKKSDKLGSTLAAEARERVSMALLAAGAQVVSQQEVAHDAVVRLALDDLDDDWFNRWGNLSFAFEGGGRILAQERRFFRSGPITLPNVVDAVVNDITRSPAVVAFVREKARAKDGPALAALTRPAAAAARAPGAGAARRIAVLEFHGAIEPPLLAAMADEARGAAAETLRPSGVAVMTRENLAVMLKEMGRNAACTEGECEVETGRLVGADLVVTGDAMRVGPTYVLILKLHETAGGTLVATRQVRGDDPLQLLEAVKAGAATLFR